MKMINDGVEVLIKEHKSLTEMVEHFGRKIVELEAERDALKELNSEFVHLLEWQQSVNNMDDSILCDRAIKNCTQQSA